MSDASDERPAATTPERDRRLGDLAGRLAIELVIGLALAVVLLLVAWASSSAIRFVYGGY